jgi:hypothetical protein
MSRSERQNPDLLRLVCERNQQRQDRVLGRPRRRIADALSPKRKSSKSIVSSEVAAAHRALTELLADGKGNGYRKYLLEHTDGEWVFRRDELDLMVEIAIERAFGRSPEPDDDRRYGFNLR